MNCYIFIVYLFVFQILIMRRFRCINHGSKVGELSLPTLNQLWFWNTVRASGLHDLDLLIYMGTRV